MTTEISIFNFDESGNGFENSSHSNGKTTWFARELMEMLGYESWNSFKAIINRATSACIALDINVMENFEQVEREVNGSVVPDFKLTRFACYLVAMNGDPKKENVARAQVYFIAIAETFRHYLIESENVERVLIREEVSEREKSLSGVAKQHGVTNYAFFQNAGYRGMYNMNLAQLRQLKGINSKRSPLDFMGKDELAANLFRITQTELKVKQDGRRGQGYLESLAEQVGKQVRQAMLDISGTRPESLPPAEDVNTVKKGLKETHKKLKEIDVPRDNAG
jgi:DNA-damage-inducible protein D